MWNHSLCDACWEVLNPCREPHRIIDPKSELCCRCRVVHKSGIFVRLDPEALPCKGEHE